MRTKLLCAALFAACAIPAVAQNNVYSLNVVGYINAPVTQNRFAMLANQLNATPNNSITNVLSQSGIPDSTTVLQFQNGQWAASTETYLGGVGWIPGTMVLNPGQGFAVQCPQNYTLTFVGEVIQGTTTNALPAGYSLIAAMTPQSLPLGDATTPAATTLNFPAADSDTYIPWNPAASTAGSFGDPITYLGGVGWIDPANPSNTTGPSPALATSFFMLKGAQANWVRTFNVQ